MTASPPAAALQNGYPPAPVDDSDEPPRPPVSEPNQDHNQDEDMYPTLNDNNDSNTLESSFFPSPSHYYKRYTSHNLSLPLDHPDSLHNPTDEAKVSTSLNNTDRFTRMDLEPPQLDWVLERGSYTVFGEVWPVNDQLPSLREMGVEELWDPNQTASTDRRQSLQTLLQALLVTYHQLVTALLAPPRSIKEDAKGLPSDPERFVERIRLIGINLHHLINELRPVQAKESLKAMMRTQIEQRKARTNAIQQKCQEMNQALASLSTKLERAVIVDSETTMRKEAGNLNPARAVGVGVGKEGDPMETALSRLKEKVDGL
ncbi:BZ3500_MvSof-1268-A1-R1_Chr12-1g03666 [Microbotryum saponariae]|uniref:Mediator of RNA polymerase II transcription subunit 7 n=1 Tax=Microbotryum saponariae TaxID=289078 RepID=A0A2X0LHJ3_9BASI|nr:BZ3500_MvSof-1268-A1-R1_Chr12-1g03666 [Microbotryum saponariae]SDA05259.1 BZ3501_MvSof-1269-A2-R1_Chr12-1g03243 [Microbotryum saponariae]